VTEGAREEYAAAVRPRYERAGRTERGRILDEYCRVTGCHRKAAIRALRRAPRGRGRRAGRPRAYGPELEPVLERIWVASDGLSGKLLVAVLPQLLAALERHHGLPLPAATRASLVAASAATLDRLLRPLRRRRARHPRRPSPARGSVRGQVPLRTWGDWAGVRPGAVQGDLVLHCGESGDGFYLTTLVAVDVATTWTELEAVWGLGHRRVGTGIHRIRGRLPFALREWHSDNGSEFINTHLVTWCRQERVRFTRGRPYRKNDQAWVEQRNGLAVRRLVGYDRYSSRAAFGVLQRLYGLLRLQLNFVRPVRKLLSKHRSGAQVVKRYDAPRTPYQRVLEAGVLTPGQRDALAAQCAALDPIALAREIEQTLDVLWKLADTRRAPQEVARG
jgi:hypothetical protein